MLSLFVAFIVSGSPRRASESFYIARGDLFAARPMVLAATVGDLDPDRPAIDVDPDPAALQHCPVQGGVLVVTALMVFVNVVVDIVYAFLDPRVRYDAS